MTTQLGRQGLLVRVWIPLRYIRPVSCETDPHRFDPAGGIRIFISADRNSFDRLEEGHVQVGAGPEIRIPEDGVEFSRWTVDLCFRTTPIASHVAPQIRLVVIRDSLIRPRSNRHIEQRKRKDRTRPIEFGSTPRRRLLSLPIRLKSCRLQSKARPERVIVGTGAVPKRWVGEG